MPIPKNTTLAAVQGMLAARIDNYNATIGAAYNPPYRDYIAARSLGIAATGSLSAWLATNGAASVQSLLKAFGMDARNSELVSQAKFEAVLSGLSPATVNWIADLAIPFSAPPPNLVNSATGENLSLELRLLYDVFAEPGSVTESGGYVAATKTQHCLFPGLAPMVDGRHSGISYYNIDRATYVQPSGIGSWSAWMGMPIKGALNPSPRGAGRNMWRGQQFMATIGVNQCIYELWQSANGNPGLQTFLALDPTPGTTGIPRVIDKGLW